MDADVAKTNFQQAILVETDLRGVNLSKVGGISSEQLRVALIDETTRHPCQFVVQKEEWWGEVQESCWFPPQLVA